MPSVLLGQTDPLKQGLKMQNIGFSKKKLKLSFQFCFYCLFLWFSLKSMKSFYLGEVIYDFVIDNDNEKTIFPGVTLCPNQLNPFVNLKLEQLRKDLS